MSFVTSDKTAKKKLNRLVHWLLKHVLLVFFVMFVTSFSIVNFVELYQSLQIEKLFQANLVLSLVSGLFLTLSWDLTWTVYRKMFDRAWAMHEKTLRKEYGKPVMRRLASRKYYLLSFYCLFLLGAVSLFFSIRNYQSASSYSILSALPTMFFIETSIVSLDFYMNIVNDKELAVFYLRRFFIQFESVYKEENIKFSIKNLSKGLKHYQKTLPPVFKLKSLNRRLGQIQLLLERSPKAELKRFTHSIKQIINAVDSGNHQQFDDLFLKLIDLLDASEKSKAEVIELKEATRRENIRSFFSPIAKNVLEKILYAIALFIIGVVLYWVGHYLGYIKI